MSSGFKIASSTISCAAFLPIISLSILGDKPVPGLLQAKLCLLNEVPFLISCVETILLLAYNFASLRFQYISYL